VEVLVTRALDLLQSGRFKEARQESARAMGLDASQRATFIFGVACAREGDFTAAIEAFEQVLKSSTVDDFSQLPLELGLALLASQQPEAARIWLEKAQTRLEDQALASEGLAKLDAISPPPGARHLWLKVGLLTGMDSNPSGLPGVSWSGCEPAGVGAETLSQGCGVVLGENAVVGMRARQGVWQGQVFYGFVHRWYPTPDQQRFNLQQHRLSGGLEHAVGVGLSYELSAQSLADRYDPLYGLEQHLNVHHRRDVWHTPTPSAVGSSRQPGAHSRLGYEVAYQLDQGLYADLTTLWQTSSAACSEPLGEGSTSIYCTSQRSGLTHQARLALEWQSRRVDLRLEGTGLRFNAVSAQYDGSGLGGRLQLLTGSVDHLRFSGQLGLQRQWLPGWWVSQVQLNGSVQHRLYSNLMLGLRYGLDRVAVSLPDAPEDAQLQRRQQGTLEVNYEF